MATNLMTTLKGSRLEGFFPRGWNLAKIDKLMSRPPSRARKREAWWHRRFKPVPCDRFPEHCQVSVDKFFNGLRFPILDLLLLHGITFFLG